MSFAKAFDIEVRVVPGISSCIAVPELQEVPLTCRGVNESFWVLTGTTQSGHLSKDVAIAAQSSATAVILMGMRKIAEITALFARYGKAQTPVMVIQNGSRQQERTVLGTVENIAEKVKAAGVGAPGIIVIGEVVALHPELNYATVAQQKLKTHKPN
ncbi:MAG: SAM-dependent methyltransferase [Bacteroidota bacterium]